MSIKIESINNVKNVNDLKYQDLKLDFEYSYTQNSEFLKVNEIKDLKVDFDFNAIKNSLRNIFTTNRGEKLLNPYFGAGLASFLFESVSESTAKSIGDTIVQNIALFEPRVKLNNVNIIANEDDNSYSISLIISVPQLKLELVNLTATLNNNGFTFV
jgi:phage baseplate assembly protein W